MPSNRRCIETLDAAAACAASINQGPSSHHESLSRFARRGVFQHIGAMVSFDLIAPGFMLILRQYVSGDESV